MGTKQIIIENFIDWYTSNESERIRMKDALQSYLDEDHVDELSLQDRITGMFINQMKWTKQNSLKHMVICW